MKVQEHGQNNDNCPPQLLQNFTNTTITPQTQLEKQAVIYEHFFSFVFFFLLNFGFYDETLTTPKSFLRIST